MHSNLLHCGPCWHHGFQEKTKVLIMAVEALQDLYPLFWNLLSSVLFLNSLNSEILRANEKHASSKGERERGRSPKNNGHTI